MEERDWSFSSVWNECIAGEERVLIPRNYCYASELGAAMYDRWHKMRGVQPTTPPNLRARRKFSAGGLWEWTAYFVLKQSGMLITNQRKVDYSLSPELLSVHGKLDFIGGGSPDYDKAAKGIIGMDLPDFIKNTS